MQPSAAAFAAIPESPASGGTIPADAAELANQAEAGAAAARGRDYSAAPMWVLTLMLAAVLLMIRPAAWQKTSGQPAALAGAAGPGPAKRDLKQQHGPVVARHALRRGWGRPARQRSAANATSAEDRPEVGRQAV